MSCPHEGLVVEEILMWEVPSCCLYIAQTELNTGDSIQELREICKWLLEFSHPNDFLGSVSTGETGL